MHDLQTRFLSCIIDLFLQMNIRTSAMNTREDFVRYYFEMLVGVTCKRAAFKLAVFALF